MEYRVLDFQLENVELPPEVNIMTTWPLLLIALVLAVIVFFSAVAYIRQKKFSRLRQRRR